MPICMWPRVKGIVEVPDMRKGNDLVDGRNNVISACQKFRDEVMKDNWRKKTIKNMLILSDCKWHEEHPDKASASFVV